MIKVDIAIIRRAAGGDRKAFEMIVSAFGGLVFSIAYRMTYDREEARDLSQEVFMHLYQNLHKFSLEGELHPWLSRVATNCCINIVKKKKLRTASLDLIEEKREIRGSEDAAPEEVMENEKHEALREAVKSLPPEYSAAIALKYEEDLSVEELSQRLGISVSAAKVRLFRAREKIRKKMENYGK